MPDWLIQASGAGTGIPPGQQAVRLLSALALGLCVALIFRISHGRTHPRAATLTTTLILLAMLIAMVSMVIGSSVALAFSLVGALSIVRFRTVVEDTRDTAFVIFAVIVGMAAGAGQLLVPLIGMPLVGLVSVILSLRSGSQQIAGYRLTVRIGIGRSAEEALHPVLEKYCTTLALAAAGTTKQGAAIELSYVLTLKSKDVVLDIVRELNQVEGIQSAELRLDD